MSRLEFRAYIPDAKSKAYNEKGCDYFYQNNQYLSSFIRRIYDSYRVSHPTYLPFELEARLEQYTGLKCLNKVKIFKGDLLHKLDPCGIEVLTVEQLDCESGFCVQVGEFTRCYLTQDHINKNELVVIGNIHENPELLEQS